MKIAVIAHIRFPVSMPFKGGMEAHSWQLVKALEARGHTVHLYASGDSDPELPLHSIRSRHYEADHPWSEAGDSAFYQALEREAFMQAMTAIETERYDVVHNNCLHPFPIDQARKLGIPVVTSLHVPPFEPLAEAVRTAREPWTAFTATSRFHARQWQLDPVRGGTVYNGIDFTDSPLHESGNGRAIWAGRIVDYKGPHFAVAAARHAGIALDLYGPVEHREYFSSMIESWLGEEVRYHGLADSRTIRQALAAASVLLFTPMWDEPFGLVAAEAMAGGTPIAAFDNGAVREVIGPNGVYVEAGDVDALAAAIRKARMLDRKDCAAFAREHYGIDRMIRGYEEWYERVRAARPV